MPGILLNFIRERQKRIINRLEWEKRKRVLHGGRIVKGCQEGAAQREWRIQEPYDFSQSAGKKLPFFGSNTNESFGLDWAVSKSFNPPAIGPRTGVSAPIRQRRGSTINLKPLKVHEKSEIQETRRGGLSYQKTDQKPPKRRSMVNWDGVVRNDRGKVKGFQSFRGLKEPTAGDRLTAEMKKEEIYSFF